MLQREGEPRGIALHGAGIRNRSASGCLPKALENSTFQRPSRGHFLLPAALFGGLLPKPGRTVVKCTWEVSLLTLQPSQLVLLLPDATVSGIPPHSTDKSSCFHDILPCPRSFLEVARVTGEHLRKKSFPLVLQPKGKQELTMKAARGTIQVCPVPTANAGITVVSQDTEERREKFTKCSQKHLTPC